MNKNLRSKYGMERIAWSPNEVASMCGLSLSFIRKEVKSGRLKGKKLGRRILILDRDLTQYLTDLLK